jgi:hypothetical protein
MDEPVLLKSFRLVLLHQEKQLDLKLQALLVEVDSKPTILQYALVESFRHPLRESNKSGQPLPSSTDAIEHYSEDFSPCCLCC